MKASKFSDAQKAFILKQGDDGVPVAEICRKAGISQALFQLAQEVCGSAARRDASIEGSGRREFQTEEDRRGLTLDREMLSRRLIRGFPHYQATFPVGTCIQHRHRCVACRCIYPHTERSLATCRLECIFMLN